MPAPPLTDADLARLQRLADDATPGPWNVDDAETDTGVPFQHVWQAQTGTGVFDTYHDDAIEMPAPVVAALEREWGRPVVNRTSPPIRGIRANAEFAIACRDEVPRLIAEVRRLRAVAPDGNRVLPVQLFGPPPPARPLVSRWEFWAFWLVVIGCLIVRLVAV